MYIYAGLFESMMECCGRLGLLRHGPIYTLTMIALGLVVSLNLLSVIQLLWTFGVLDNPYRINGDLHSQRYIFGMVYLAFLANTVLARVKFAADQRRLQPIRLQRGPNLTTARPASSSAAAPLYVLVSTSLFIVTLSLSLRNLG
jgi:hypothetical protein